MVKRHFHVENKFRKRLVRRVMEQRNAITEEEAEQYDRQIRLWGVEAQKKYVNNIKSCVQEFYTLCT